LIENEPDGSPDKAKPSVRRGRKAAGLLMKMAELPKQEVFTGAIYEMGLTEDADVKLQTEFDR